MAWWWPFGGARVSNTDAQLLRRRCGSRTSALAVCLAANAGSPKACAAFETDVLLCRSTVLYPKQADAFMKCTQAAALATKLEDMPDCDKEAQRMRRCLRGYRLPKDAK